MQTPYDADIQRLGQLAEVQGLKAPAQYILTLLRARADAYREGYEAALAAVKGQEKE